MGMVRTRNGTFMLELRAQRSPSHKETGEIAQRYGATTCSLVQLEIRTWYIYTNPQRWQCLEEVYRVIYTPEHDDDCQT